jgi:hypothetical protein
MKNWKLIAEANQLRIPTPDLERITPALDALEVAFRPLVKTIPDDVEPAVSFYVFPESAR